MSSEEIEPPMSPRAQCGQGREGHPLDEGRPPKGDVSGYAKSISHNDPISRMVIWLAEKAALEDHLVWEAEQRRCRAAPDQRD
ncbi:hypothetical protein [Mesorhizobium sp. NZP2077]|uniref:hypothetical protein n=1 Tax=Mesorhizobium sp. NZP2077 TaxID=2483404 RepID=UPI0015521541|nr:hypothetical protein [Mesorhizobium sp. NZP2077]QKD19417.1 hypothetical protein HGP13_33035 [Mesorhizobium sp. NZP2077]